ncbi:MAG: hypothetical protein GY873_30320 [Bosea sp.]|uniref:hypothetical protein n=1 Tax=Bosea sp. (in: a-proteobacteria) TaxID=1871050 RepID=UPI0023908D60|nr:hypothetical protein [Bosea sp. (in: a-proteobacteria)]MCP4738492.1 hypothetical protein [Bosea sp. (in: a-proteobacteria)]
MIPLSTDLAKGLPPAGAAGDFIGRDGAGNFYLLRWQAGPGWQALGWEGAGEAARPSCRPLTGTDIGLITAHRAIGKAVCRADLDAAVLAALADRHDAMTYVIRNIASERPGWRDLTTARILTACRRLARADLIEEVPSIYAVMLCWRITEAGRARHTLNLQAKGAH